MSTKAVTKERTSATTTSTNGNRRKAAQPDYKLIHWKHLQPSPTNPRRRINERSIESLAGSIRTQGILEPLIVRPSGKKYEIVCGERRYRAAEAVKDYQDRPAPLTILPCLVRELTDEQVLDIQIHENLHREDVQPMDEAYGYKFLKERINCDLKELALRVGKSESYVLNRLKLNSLIEEAQKDIDEEYLPLSYALEIAKYLPKHSDTFTARYTGRRDNTATTTTYTCPLKVTPYRGSRSLSGSTQMYTGFSRRPRSTRRRPTLGRMGWPV